MNKTRRTFLVYNLLLLLAAGGIAGYLWLLARTGLRALCPFSFFTHLYCPGCGFTRAGRALLQLDLPAALGANPMAPWLLLTLGYYEIAFFLAWRRGRRVARWPAILFAYALVAYAILRNLLLVFFAIDPLGDLIQFWS